MGNAGGNPEFHQHVHETAVDTLGDGLRTDRHAFRRLDASAPEIVELRAWSHIADELSGERTRLANRAREQLWRYYPQFLKVEGDLAKA